ncbi:MAG: VOC family protein [Gammaproteobacteria bacterium]|nr:VOC family protein [Gammaproteobacteria bacterium]
MEFTGIHHASLEVANTRRSLDFYQTLLGMTVMEDRPQLGFPGAWIQLGTQQLHLLELPTTGECPQDQPDHTGRGRHTALVVTDIGALKARLERYNIPYTVSRSGRNALFCRDPDGNGLEFIQA